MNIYPVNSNYDSYNISMHGKAKNPNWIKKQLKRVGQKVLDMLPNRTSEESKKEYWDKSSHFIGHPMWNRGIMGVSALLTQPAIDYYNHRVDEETRTVSRNRTAAKIIAGTLVGMFVVRGPVNKVVEKMTKINGKSNLSKKLLPKKYIEKLKNNPRALNNYISSLSMAFILVINCITNFVLDAPLTVFLTNYFNKKSNVIQPTEKEEKQTEIKEAKYD